MATSITTIQSTDLITNSRADINNNFDSLLVNKIETDVITTDSTFAAASDSKLPSQLAVKQYVDAGGNPDIAAAQAGGGDFGTPSATNKFVTEEKMEVSVTQTTVYELSDSPATWTKPTGAKLVKVQLWGGGGSGGSNTGDAGGGGGGVYVEGTFPASALGSTETVTIGAGGVGVATGNNGNPGGNSSFGSLVTAYGGGGGGQGAAGNNGGGGSGGSWEAAGAAGGATTGGVPTTTFYSGLLTSSFFGYGMDSDGTLPANSVSGIYSAGGGSGYGNASFDYPGKSVWGGGGGCGTGIGIVGGTSVFGGAGGALNSDGVTPAGGGGANEGGTSGAGGNGRVIVTTYF